MCEKSEMEAKILNLHTLRDSFFIFNAEKSADDRQKFLSEKVEILETELNELKVNLSKADYYYFLGKLQNAKSSNYEIKVEENLSKSVKLNPNHADAWNELGECLWKKADLAGAKNCFESALQKEKNKLSLRNLSIILRQLCKNDVETMKQSFQLAKDAVELDPMDGVSLYVLGNAYLTYFFFTAQLKPELIENALESYEKASKDEKVLYNADLYFNRAVALRYEESYQEALDCYRRAVALDPWFTTAKQQLQQLQHYLPQVYDNVVRKGKMKQKRVQELVKSIHRQTGLGPFSGGQYQSSQGLKCDLKYTLLSDLQIGPNPSRVCLGRVVATIFNENIIPLTFCVVDESNFCTAVTVYNFNEKFGVTIGQSVAIAEPFYALVDVKIDNTTLKFPSIRVPTPEIMVVNGRKCNKNAYASTDIVVSKN